MTLTHLPFNLALARIEQIGYARCVQFSLPASSLISQVVLGRQSVNEGGKARSVVRRRERQRYFIRSEQSRQKKAIWQQAYRVQKRQERNASCAPENSVIDRTDCRTASTDRARA